MSRTRTRVVLLLLILILLLASLIFALLTYAPGVSGQPPAAPGEGQRGAVLEHRHSLPSPSVVVTREGR